jgi:hypothetical protein
MTGTIPIPSDTTHTTVKARLFARDPAAYRKSRQMLSNIVRIKTRSLCIAKLFILEGGM